MSHPWIKHIFPFVRQNLWFNMTLGSCSHYTELCPPSFGYSSKHMESLHCLLPHKLMLMPCCLSLIIFHAIFQGNFFQAWVSPSTVCLFPSCPTILKVQSSICLKSMKPLAWSSRFSSPYPTSRRRPLGSEVVHSCYTPTRVLNILKLLLKL